MANYPTCHFPKLPFRDQIWQINFEDGRPPAYISVYNEEITGCTPNAPDEIIRGSIRNFHPWSIGKLSACGMAFFYLGLNE